MCRLNMHSMRKDGDINWTEHESSLERQTQNKKMLLARLMRSWNLSKEYWKEVSWKAGSSFTQSITDLHEGMCMQAKLLSVVEADAMNT